MNHLQSKEEMTYRVADAYHENTGVCVDKIARKHEEEKGALLEINRLSAIKFSRNLQRVRAALEESEQKRDAGVDLMKQLSTSRRTLFQRATTEMRALHRRLLEG